MSVAELGDRVAAIRRLFYTCDYAELGCALPLLIADLRRAATGSSRTSTVISLLATAYQTSASLLLKLGDVGHAWMAVGRAMAEAERCGDPVVLASSVRVHAHVLA